MVALTVVLLWLLSDASFRVTGSSVEITGLTYADEADVRDHLDGLERSPNAFRVRASEIVGRLEELPEVASASARVSLPGTVAIEVREREPIFAWSDGGATYLVDREGVLFAPVDGEATDLPLVEDGRLVERPWQLGARLPAADLAVMRQLLTLTPATLGSRSEWLRLRVDQQDGYVLDSEDWQAVFGHYTPRLQPPDVVPRQVQCLTWLLADRERVLERITLAVSATGCGTRTEVDRRG
jgi:cell division septal protein FtsQ